MKQNIVKVKSVDYVTHDVLKIVTERPHHFTFIPGQATEVSINKNGWKDEKRPFTFTCLPDKDYLEFTIKTYPTHKGVTNELKNLTTDDELILHEVFGTIAYKGEGIFIAGGAGITPFISILRYLQMKKEIGNNKLLFANKTKADIILEEEFKNILGANFINILSHDKGQVYANGQITEQFIKANCESLGVLFYVCGPPPMMEAIGKQLANLQVNEQSIIKEIF
ncbi:MAG: flavodoxin reductase [Chitinophagales bacterium]